MKSEKSIKTQNMLEKVGMFLIQYANEISFLIVFLLIPARVVYADEAETLWNNIWDILVPWIQRIGAAIAVIGGIMFAFAWRNDDADTKQRGLQTFVAGVMAVAVASAAKEFLYIGGSE